MKIAPQPDLRMPPYSHPILQQSFAIIDRELGAHPWTTAEYEVIRRVIHSTADFEFQHLLRWSEGAIEGAIAALAQGLPIVTDVQMVTYGIQTLVQSTFNNPVITAVALAPTAAPGQTRTETGLRQCLERYPEAVFVIGNAPTALLALCHSFQQDPPPPICPSCVIGAPVGFVSVVEAKQALAQTSLPHIRIEGRKGGSAAAAAIVNALLTLAWRRTATPAVPFAPGAEH